MEYNVGDVVMMKKPHPCGNREFEITRTGADFKLKCLGCGRIVMLDIGDFTKRLKKTIKSADMDK